MSFAEAARDEAERQQRIEAKLDRLLAELAALRASQSPRLVSPSEAAKALGVSIATCRRRIADGTLPPGTSEDEWWWTCRVFGQRRHRRARPDHDVRADPRSFPERAPPRRGQGEGKLSKPWTRSRKRRPKPELHRGPCRGKDPRSLSR